MHKKYQLTTIKETKYKTFNAFSYQEFNLCESDLKKL